MKVLADSHLDENVRKKSNNDDEKAGEVEAGVSHQRGVHIIVQGLG